jgi:PKD repeat protein
MKKTLLTFFMSSALFCTAQKESIHWYFGNHAGLDFTAGAPVADLNGALVTDEGCASISDANGQLLFYTGGVEVYNSNHTIMPNGFNLNGSTTSSQSSIIVKKPGSLTEYYIFTTDGVGGPKGLCYSTVDMTLQGGLGDVVIKNQQLMPTTCEHLTATLHANGTDVWVMAHDVSNHYYAYLVTATGVSAPVITAIGTVPVVLQASMKFSTAGDKLACPYQGTTFFEVMDFDNSTGILSNVMQLNDAAWIEPFAVEFSPTGKYLYAVHDPAGTGVLLQFDMSLGTQAAITASAVVVGNYNPSYFGSLQIGPDFKLYAGELGNSYVGVVNYPDSPGVACNFVVNGVFLGGMISNYGLPNFITSYFQPNLQPVAFFTAPNHLCPGTCTSFLNNSSNATSFLWLFPGATPNTSVDQYPSNICYNTPGNYPVTLIATNANGSDTLTLNNYVTVYPSPAPQGISQNGDTLFAIAGAVGYQWYFNGNIITGATGYFYVAQASGDYNVVATDANGCEVEAVIFSVIASVQSIGGSGIRMNITPNPVVDFLVFQIPSSPGNTFIDVRIYNMLGETVFTAGDTRMQSIDCRDFSQGMYVLEVHDGNKIYRTKFNKSSRQ